MAPSWESLAAEKRSSILAAIPPEWRIPTPPSVEQQVDVSEYVKQFLSPRELEITECSADEIAAKTTTGQWSAETVVSAFCHRASVGHQLLHCLHEVFFNTAIEDARKLDAYYAQHKSPVGPLHGVPVSLKDQFHVRGVETTMGYVGWINTFEGKQGTGKEKVFESEMVRELRNAGAVLYCKTSVPHTLMAGETVNNIIGYTLNPKNRHLTSGGSSGGEGALIGIRGSPLGFGTDIAGSIRIPAAFNGLYGLRPSTGRLPYEGMANSMDGQNSILSVVGPLATNAASLCLATKALLSQNPWLHDPLVHEIPWREEQYQEAMRLTTSDEKLCFGLIETDGIVNPIPPVHRALGIVVAALRSAGHTVVPWKGPSHQPILDAALKTWMFDGGNDVRGAFALSGEPMADEASFYSSVLKEFTGSEIAATNVELRRLKKEYLSYWTSTSESTGTGRPIDALICPVAPWPAARRGRYKYYGYSAWVNVLDYTSVTVPVTNADQSVDVKDEGYTPISERDKAIYEDYDAELYHGAHVGLQIVGRRLQEEKMLAIAEYIGGLVGK